MEASLLVTYETQYPLSMIYAMRTLLWSRVADLYNLFGNHVSQFAFCFSKKIRGMTISLSSGQSVSLRDADSLHNADMRNIQQNTFDIMSKCSEIERMMSVGSQSARDLIDASVRKSVETQQLLDRYKSFFGCEATKSDAKHRRLFDNFERANKKLEEVIRKYRESANQIDPNSSQMKRVDKYSAQTSFSQTFDVASSLEEGRQTLHDLNRISKEMTNLQDIYVSLNDTAVSHQSSIIDSVQSRVSAAATTAKQTVEELSRAKNRMDYWTRIKLYTVTGVTAIGIFIWLV